MSHNNNTTTTHRRHYAPPTPDTTMNHPQPTTNHHPDPPTTTTTIQNISNHFSRLYLNHKALSTQPQPQTTVTDISTTASLTKSNSQSQRTRLSSSRGKPHYYYANKPVKQQHHVDEQEDNIKRAIVVSNKIPTQKKDEKDQEKNGFDEIMKLPNGYDVKRQNLSSSNGTGVISKGLSRRRSFGSSSQAELADFFACNGVKVVSADMPPYMQIHVVDVTRKTYDSLEKFTAKTLASTLKKEFDGVYGPAWHCIVGSSFGSFVTHSVGGFMYFSMDQKLYVLLFKTAVQRAH
ncbi:uncharacterized protein [Rutidosis leptorrhynchoides]|uniref:uncharacterized protein n=1 Tax=Rutidosis leptorrhynchoides TaxID=125765 RepID=UPI003A98D79F